MRQEVNAGAGVLLTLSWKSTRTLLYIVRALRIVSPLCSGSFLSMLCTSERQNDERRGCMSRERYLGHATQIIEDGKTEKFHRTTSLG